MPDRPPDRATACAPGDAWMRRTERHPPGGHGWDALMAAAQDGDARAYEAVLRAVVPFLRAVARRRIADPAEAEDAVQDTLLALHRSRASYDPARPLRPWLVALCERRCTGRLRRRYRLKGRELALDRLLEAGPGWADPWAGNAGEARVAAAQLRAAVAALPVAQRTAVVLAKLENLPLEEASARSGMSVGALKVATHRGRRSLRRRLDTTADAPGGYAGGP